MKLKMYILAAVDTEPLLDPFIPIHGLSISILLIDMGINILYNVGPDMHILLRNLRLGGLSLKIFNYIVISRWLNPFSGALNMVLRKIGLQDTKVIVPPPRKRVNKKLIIVGDDGIEINKYIYISPPFGLPNKEIGLIVDLGDRGLLLFLGCSHIGIVESVEKILKFIGRRDIYGIIGGLHLSYYDELTFEELEKKIPEWGLKFMIPLYCTGSRARIRLLDVIGSDISFTGVGTYVYI